MTDESEIPNSFEEFATKLTSAWEDITKEPANDYILMAGDWQEHYEWWLAAKSHLIDAPEHAWHFIISNADPCHDGDAIIASWSYEQAQAFYEWASKLPGWEDGAIDTPVNYLPSSHNPDLFKDRFEQLRQLRRRFQ